VKNATNFSGRYEQRRTAASSHSKHTGFRSGGEKVLRQQVRGLFTKRTRIEYIGECPNQNQAAGRAQYAKLASRIKQLGRRTDGNPGSTRQAAGRSDAKRFRDRLTNADQSSEQRALT
jgi:hypothetical protein